MKSRLLQDLIKSPVSLFLIFFLIPDKYFPQFFFGTLTGIFWHYLNTNSPEKLK